MKKVIVLAVLVALLVGIFSLPVAADGQRRYGNCYVTRRGGAVENVLVPTPWDGFWRFDVVAQIGVAAADSAHVVLYFEDGDSTTIRFKQSATEIGRAHV